MAPLTWGLRLPRNGSASACGPCLGGSSGRGIGARAPACLLHPLPPTSRLLLDLPRPPRPLLAAPAAGSSIGQIGSFARAQELLRQGHSYLDRNGDGVAFESLR